MKCKTSNQEVTLQKVKDTHKKRERHNDNTRMHCKNDNKGKCYRIITMYAGGDSPSYREHRDTEEPILDQSPNPNPG